jgi:hypothetical protein
VEWLVGQSVQTESNVSEVSEEGHRNLHLNPPRRLLIDRCAIGGPKACARLCDRLPIELFSLLLSTGQLTRTVAGTILA